MTNRKRTTVNEGDLRCVLCQHVLSEKGENPDIHKEKELIKYIKCTNCGNSKVFSLIIERDEYGKKKEIIIQWDSPNKRFIRWTF